MVFFPVAPSSVTITRSQPMGDIEVGAPVTYTCSSIGGMPEPTIRLLVGVKEKGSGTGPTYSLLVNTETGMHDQPVVCEAFNGYGSVNATEHLILFREKK